jgi:hypothetical protein
LKKKNVLDFCTIKIYEYLSAMNNGIKILFFAILVFLGMFGISFCSVKKAIEPDSGQLVKYDSIGYYSKERVQSVIDSVLDIFLENRTMTPSEFRSRFTPALYGVRLFKVTYTSIIPEKNNQAVITYGLVAIPDNVLPGAPIVSYQHGTIFDRASCPSNPDGSIELQFQLSQFASQGYIVIAADYFGNTEGTQEQNSYGILGSAARSCLDMLTASKEFLKQRNISPGKLFLNGWSQGGASTNAFLQLLEQEKIPVAGAITASGPAEQVIFLQKPILEPTPFVAPYFPAVIGNLLFSFESYIGLEGLPEQMIRPEYLEISRKLYNFEISFNEYLQKVLIDENGKWRAISDVFTQQFIDESKAATSPFWKSIDATNGYRWQMRTPYRCFYSYRDEAVVAEAAKIIVDYQKSLGNTAVESYDAGSNADHASVYLESLIYAKPWFDSLQ